MAQVKLTAIIDGQDDDKVANVVQSTSDLTRYGLVVTNSNGSPLTTWYPGTIVVVSDAAAPILEAPNGQQYSITVTDGWDTLTFTAI